MIEQFKESKHAILFKNPDDPAHDSHVNMSNSKLHMISDTSMRRDSVVH